MYKNPSRASIRTGGLALLFGLLVWSGLNAFRLFAAEVTAFPAGFKWVIDAQGPNDQPGQKDLSVMGRWDHANTSDPYYGYLDIFWNWDDAATTGANTFDACALFDSDGDSKINYAICAQVKNFGSNAAPLMKLNTADGYPKVYSCDDTLPYNCGSAAAMATPSSVAAGDLVNLNPNQELTTKTDPFPQGGNNPYDTTVRIRFKKADLPSATLVNVCTYPSASPSSAASDCMANAGGGFLQIVKDATGGDDTFTFDVSPVPVSNGGGPCDPAVGGCQSYTAKTFNGAGATGGISLEPQQTSVTVKERDQSPSWILIGASCKLENGTPTGALSMGALTVSNITIEPESFTTCTFTNSKNPAYVTITKQVINDNGGSATVGQFALLVGETAVTSGVETGMGPGTYAISESGPSGYRAYFNGPDCDSSGNIVLQSGKHSSCTMVNDDIAPSLTLSKIVINDNGGTASPGDFTLSAAGPSPISGLGVATSSSTFIAGAYTLSESGPAGYAAGAWSCTAGAISGNRITLSVGGSASCTISNDDVQPRLIVIKHVINNNGGTKVASDFTMSVTASSASPSSFPGSEAGTAVALNAGNYSVTESGPANYTASYSADCSGSIAVGQTKTCIVTNDDLGSGLTVVKHVINDNGGAATAGQWRMHVDGSNPSQNDFAGSEGGVMISIGPGSYSVSETGGPSGYAASLGAGCSGVMTAGGSALCVITNDDIAPRLTLTKLVVNSVGGTASPGDWTLSAAGATPISGSGGAISDAAFKAGAYSLSESGGPSNYSAGNWSCVGGSLSGSSLTIGVGQTASCSITNTYATAPPPEKPPTPPTPPTPPPPTPPTSPTPTTPTTPTTDGRFMTGAGSVDDVSFVVHLNCDPNRHPTASNHLSFTWHTGKKSHTVNLTSYTASCSSDDDSGTIRGYITSGKLDGSPITVPVFFSFTDAAKGGSRTGNSATVDLTSVGGPAVTGEPTRGNLQFKREDSDD